MIALRPILDSDMTFLYHLYASTRETEMQQVTHWTEADKTNFLVQQFLAQHQYYQDFYTGASLQLITENQEPVGRLYVHWTYSDDEIRIMDIALIPPKRRMGIGRKLLSDIFAKAAEMRKDVTIHVEFNNPALKLYQRLGFEKIGEFNTVYHLYRWRPESKRP